MSPISERIIQLIDILGIKRKPFADSIGISTQAISNWIHRGLSPQFDNIQMILSIYPEVNARWLILGEGKPLLRNFENSVTEPTAGYNKDLFDYTKLMAKVQELEAWKEAAERRIKKLEKSLHNNKNLES